MNTSVHKKNSELGRGALLHLPPGLRQLSLCFSLFPLHTEPSFSGLLTIVLNDLRGKSKTSPEGDNYYENTPVLVTRKLSGEKKIRISRVGF